MGLGNQNLPWVKRYPPPIFQPYLDFALVFVLCLLRYEVIGYIFFFFKILLSILPLLWCCLNPGVLVALKSDSLIFMATQIGGLANLTSPNSRMQISLSFLITSTPSNKLIPRIHSLWQNHQFWLGYHYLHNVWLSQLLASGKLFVSLQRIHFLSAPWMTDRYIGKQSKATCVHFIPSMHTLITVRTAISTAFMSETGVDVSPIQFPGHLDVVYLTLSYLISVHDIHTETLSVSTWRDSLWQNDICSRWYCLID